MGSIGENKPLHCRCCRDGRSLPDFQKIADIAGTGRIISRHKYTNINNNQASVKVNESPPVFNISPVVSLRSTNNEEVVPDECFQKCVLERVTCLRCKKNIEKSKRVLEHLSMLDENTIRGICKHCLMNCNKPCSGCTEILNKYKIFFINKDLKPEILLRWLSQVQNIINGIVNEREKLITTEAKSHSDSSFHMFRKYSERALSMPEFYGYHKYIKKYSHSLRKWARPEQLYTDINMYSTKRIDLNLDFDRQITQQSNEVTSLLHEEDETGRQDENMKKKLHKQVVFLKPSFTLIPKQKEVEHIFSRSNLSLFKTRNKDILSVKFNSTVNPQKYVKIETPDEPCSLSLTKQRLDIAFDYFFPTELQDDDKKIKRDISSTELIQQTKENLKKRGLEIKAKREEMKEKKEGKNGKKEKELEKRKDNEISEIQLPIKEEVSPHTYIQNSLPETIDKKAKTLVEKELSDPKMKKQIKYDELNNEKQIKHSEPKIEKQTKHFEPNIVKQIKHPEPKIEKQIKQPEPKIEKQIKHPEPKIETQIKQPRPKIEKQIIYSEPKIEKQIKHSEPKIEKQINHPKIEKELNQWKSNKKNELNTNLTYTEVKEIESKIKTSKTEVSQVTKGQETPGKRKEGEDLSKQKLFQDDRKLLNTKAKDDATKKLQIMREAKSEPKLVSSKMKSTEKPTNKELKLKDIKIRKGSDDDLIFQLVKLKHVKRAPIQSYRKVTDMPEAESKSGHLSMSESMICLEPVSESETEKFSNLEQDKIADIIIGKKIYKQKNKIEKKNAEKLPIFYKSEYHENQEPIKNGSSAIESYFAVPSPSQKKKYIEQDTKGIVHYALSDRTFIDKGWTMLPTEKVVRKMNVYRMRPAHPEFDWFSHNKTKREMFYDSEEKLAEIDENGRGRWFYKNGRLALDYYNAEEMNAQQRYVVYSSGELDERGRSYPITVLATFDYLGNGIVFDHSGKIRLKYNQTEGVILDRGIGPVSHWKWHTLNDPPVLQQVMIDTQVAVKDPVISKLGPAEGKQRQDNEEMLAIEFDNFIKEKSKKLSQKFKPFQIKMKALKINEHFSLRVLDQATVYLIFRDGSTNLKLNIGMVLDHKEIVDTDTAEVGEVSNNVEKLPALTESIARLQSSVAGARRAARSRPERAAPAPRAALPRARLRVAACASDTVTDTCRCCCTTQLYYNTRLI